MKGDPIGKTSKAEPQTDWHRLRAMTDEEVHAGVVADPEIRPTDESFWKSARLVAPQPKKQVKTASHVRNAAPAEFMRLDARLAIDRAGRSVLPEHWGHQFYWTLRQEVKLKRSEEDPPLVRSRDGSWEDLTLDFEEILGTYEAKSRKITIYKRGIDWCTRSLSRDWNPALLEKIVELHEWSHVLHHLGPAGLLEQPSKARELRLRSNRFRKTPEDLKEQIAQLLTLLSIREAARAGLGGYSPSDFAELEKMFFELMKDQSNRYRLPEAVRAIDYRLHDKTRLILRMADKGWFLSIAEIHDILA